MAAGLTGRRWTVQDLLTVPLLPEPWGGIAAASHRSSFTTPVPEKVFDLSHAHQAVTATGLL
jgi:hypothetical protein